MPSRQNTVPKAQYSSLSALNQTVVSCELCPRLITHSRAMAVQKRRAYLDHEYWGKPVPSFGDPKASVLLVGLAPGAHGSNRTGRPFTGDGSGNFLYPVLYNNGFASQPKAEYLNDGLTLQDLWITSVGRCAPPDNKPSPQELANCAPYLDAEITLLTQLKVIVCLGKIAFDGTVASLVRRGMLGSRRGMAFAHGVEYGFMGNRILMASYHPSLQNTNTGLLTEPMFNAIFVRSRELAGLDVE